MFVKIKNWASCIPEEVRKKDEFMPIYGFEKVVYPGKVPSPFVGVGAGVVKGPGGIGEPLEKAEGEKTEGGGTGRKRTRRNPGTADAGSGTALVKTLMTGTVPATPQTAPGLVPVQAYAATAASAGGGSGDTKDRSMLTAAGTLSLPPIVDKLPPETSCVSVLLLFLFFFRFRGLGADACTHASRLL